MPPSIHEGGGTVPYDVVQDHPDCAADTPWAVTKQDTGDLMGCHATEADAREQPAAPYAEEDRKSVVEGKSVSVRVDLGGRRSIKKKNNKTWKTTRTVKIKQ